MNTKPTNTTRVTLTETERRTIQAACIAMILDLTDNQLHKILSGLGDHTEPITEQDKLHALDLAADMLARYVQEA